MATEQLKIIIGSKRAMHGTKYNCNVILRSSSCTEWWWYDGQLMIGRRSFSPVLPRRRHRRRVSSTLDKYPCYRTHQVDLALRACHRCLVGRQRLAVPLVLADQRRHLGLVVRLGLLVPLVRRVRYHRVLRALLVSPAACLCSRQLLLHLRLGRLVRAFQVGLLGLGFRWVRPFRVCQVVLRVLGLLVDRRSPLVLVVLAGMACMVAASAGCSLVAVGLVLLVGHRRRPYPVDRSCQVCQVDQADQGGSSSRKCRPDAWQCFAPRCRCAPTSGPIPLGSG